jgi:predicted phage terminase large subunit-like protein
MQRLWKNKELLSTHDLLRDKQPHSRDYTAIVEDSVYVENILNQYNHDRLKQKVLEYLLQGYSFNAIKDMDDINLTTAKIYKLKKEFEKDFAYLKERNFKGAGEYIQKGTLELFMSHMKDMIRAMDLRTFNDVFIYDYDPEANLKGWKSSEVQNMYEDVWKNHQKSCALFPREHLKTHTLLSYLVKRLAERAYPLEINYYHLSGKITVENLRRFRTIIERSPVLNYLINLDGAKSDREDKLILSDGSIVEPLTYAMGVVGKHPHIIAMDDIIDRRVMYSEDRNQKAIDKFLMDIYPQISKDDPEKQILIIGTAQRDDDVYHTLPSDFHFVKYPAVLDEEKKTVLAPDLYTYEHLMNIKKNVTEKHGMKYWLKEYMNETYNAMELIIKSEDIRYYDDEDSIPQDHVEVFRCQAWDLSVGKDPEKGDYTACCTLSVRKDADEKLYFYVLDIYRARIGFDARLQMIDNLATKYKPNAIGIEANVFQYDTFQTATKKLRWNFKPLKSVTNKNESFQVELAPHFESHKVFVKKEHTELVKELLSLPVGKHDDMADSLKLAIKLYQNKPKQRRIRTV